MLFCHLLLAFSVSKPIHWQPCREAFKILQNYFGKAKTPLAAEAHTQNFYAPQNIQAGFDM